MKHPRKIFITQTDKDRLDDLIAIAEATGERDSSNLRDLKAELARARVVPGAKIPRDVVTMNSEVVLNDLDTQEELTYTLVFPDDADFEQGMVSVLAPIGTAILGYAVGDTVEWPVPSGVRRLRLERILYQPEAAGDYNR